VAVAAAPRLAVNTSDPPMVAVWPLVGLPVNVPVAVAAVGVAVKTKVPLIVIVWPWAAVGVPETVPIWLAPAPPMFMLQSRCIVDFTGLTGLGSFTSRK